MAGLITEALTRDSQGAWKESLATERASMLETLEKLKPNLVALLEASSAKDPTAQKVDAGAVAAATPFVCRKCGHELVGEEQFCGKCGSPRINDVGPPSMQSKVASMRRMQEASQQTVRTPANGAGHQPLTAKYPLGQDRTQAEPASNQSASNPDDILQSAAHSEARAGLHQVDDPLIGAADFTDEESTEDLTTPQQAKVPVEPRGLEIHATETRLTKTDGVIS